MLTLLTSDRHYNIGYAIGRPFSHADILPLEPLFPSESAKGDILGHLVRFSSCFKE